MNSVEGLVEQAQLLQDKGDIETSLEQYSKAFDLLIDDAAQYAREQEPQATDLEALRAIQAQLFEHSRIFLKRTLMASYILNAMGVLFGELKDYDNARQRFTEALIYIPDGIEFSDPADNLERIAAEIAALQAAQETEEQ